MQIYFFHVNKKKKNQTAGTTFMKEYEEEILAKNIAKYWTLDLAANKQRGAKKLYNESDKSNHQDTTQPWHIDTFSFFYDMSPAVHFLLHVFLKFFNLPLARRPGTSKTGGPKQEHWDLGFINKVVNNIKICLYVVRERKIYTT
ncbi:hypothetical protein ACJX0J_005770 [Zea mays]